MSSYIDVICRSHVFTVIKNYVLHHPKLMDLSIRVATFVDDCIDAVKVGVVVKKVIYTPRFKLYPREVYRQNPTFGGGWIVSWSKTNREFTYSPLFRSICYTEPIKRVKRRFHLTSTGLIPWLVGTYPNTEGAFFVEKREPGLNLVVKTKTPDDYYTD